MLWPAHPQFGVWRWHHSIELCFHRADHGSWIMGQSGPVQADWAAELATAAKQNCNHQPGPSPVLDYLPGQARFMIRYAENQGHARTGSIVCSIDGFKLGRLWTTAAG